MISPESEKIRSVRNRLKELCCSHGADYPGDGAGFSGKILEKETGLCFSDIDYSSALRSEWPAKQHLERLLRILANDRGVTEENRDLCLGLLDFWLNEDPVNPNWWHNEIGTPRLLGMAAASMYDSLSPERIMRVRGIMRRGSPRGNPKCAERAGANLIWGMVNTVYLAILEEDGEMIRFAAEKTASELIASDGIKDGIKPDMSFLQHKGINYTFGYGRSFVNELCRLLYILSGTDFMPEPDKIRLFEDFILEGCASFSLFGTADYQTVGREIARPGATSVSGFGKSLLLLCGLPEIGQREKIAAYGGEILSGTAPRGTSSAVRAFPDPNMITAHSDGCYMSAKCSDTVFRCSEAGNGENYLGYNLFDGGTVCFMADGNEYSGAFPVWDNTLIPGVTTVYEKEEEHLYHK
ncbi:MAG: hypothetical protein MJ137_08300 [Clostridia bacterium]|nr:hypothetical protein [Clostridia bacterium]